MNIFNEKSKTGKYHAFRCIFLTGLGASANFSVFRRLLASTIVAFLAAMALHMVIKSRIPSTLSLGFG